MSEIKAVVAGGVIAIVGAIVSAGVSGYYVSKANEMQMLQAREALEAANARYFLEKFSEKSQPVVVSFNELIKYSHEKDFSFDNLASKADDLSKKAAALMPYVDANLYFDIDAVAGAAYDMASEKDYEVKRKKLDVLTEKVRGFMESYYKYRNGLVKKLPVPS